jgi:3-oxoacyl-[acyl-carrier protein] reductase
MSDFLLDLGQNPTARKMIKRLGLPIPVPEALRRAKGPMEERPLADLAVALRTTSDSPLLGSLANALPAAGADTYLVADTPGALAAFSGPGQAWGRPARVLDLEDAALPRLGALVFDATTVRSAAELRRLYDFYHPLVRSLAKSGRALVLGRPASAAATTEEAAARNALEGFVRSLAKEVGGRGATAQLVTVAEGAEARLAPVLRFLLSPRSAYVTGQPLHVDNRAAGEAPVNAETFALEGKVALVTGAARGIGKATAQRLAAEGAHVVCLDRPEDDGPLSVLARELQGSVLALDVTAPDAPAILVETLRARHGGVDVVVHNAGVTRDKTLARMDEGRWDLTLDVNLGAVLRMNDALLAGGDGAVLRDGGRMVLLSSIAGIAGNMGQTNYAASKAGVIGLVRHLAREVAPRGITVNAVAPGFIETRLTAAMPVAIREVARRMNALGQGGRPDDVAQAITFFSTPGSLGVTGQTLRVCGGSLVGA